MRKNKQILSEEILCAKYEAVYHYVLELCKSEVEAQDITQETFLKAIKAKDTFGGKSSLYTWLCAIAKNDFLNRCKRNSKIVSVEDLLRIEHIPAYVYAYEDFNSMNGDIVGWTWDTYDGEMYVEAHYRDGRIVRWNLEGKVLLDSNMSGD